MMAPRKRPPSIMSSAEKPRKKRTVASCTQCYAKKQKCNRVYPCDHCVKRRLPELCSYDNHATTNNGATAGGSRGVNNASPSPASSSSSMIGNSSGNSDGRDLSPSHQNLSSCFGYSENGKSNLMGLMDKFDLLSPRQCGGGSDMMVAQRDALQVLMPEIGSCLDLLPKRFIVDPLMQNFMLEVNWIYDMIHPPVFFARYEEWWKSSPAASVENLEFCVLLLRLCAYSAQYLPSRSLNTDTLGGIHGDTIRKHCHKVACQLSLLCASLPGPRTLTWVQQLFYSACYYKNESCVKEAWYTTGGALKVAQDLGMHMELPSSQMHLVGELEKDLRRRAFWNLYLGDSFLSVILERLPSIHDGYITVDLPRMRLVSDVDDAEMPAPFDAQVFHVRVTRLWWTTLPQMRMDSASYNPSVAEERYEMINKEIVKALPPAFAIHNPSLKWDHRVPMLARQRLELRITIFIVFCQIFKPLLQLTPEEIAVMPQYKHALLLDHRNRLVTAAGSILDDLAKLHELMGKTPNRYFLLSFSTFEAAMILGLHLLSYESIQKAASHARKRSDNHFLMQPSLPSGPAPSLELNIEDQNKCVRQIKEAMERLDFLGEVSNIAGIGANKLQELLRKLEDQSKSKDLGLDPLVDDNTDETSRNSRHDQVNHFSSNWFGLDTTQQLPLHIMNNAPEDIAFPSVIGHQHQFDQHDPNSSTTTSTGMDNRRGSNSQITTLRWQPTAQMSPSIDTTAPLGSFSSNCHTAVSSNFMPSTTGSRATQFSSPDYESALGSWSSWMFLDGNDPGSLEYTGTSNSYGSGTPSRIESDSNSNQISSTAFDLYRQQPSWRGN